MDVTHAFIAALLASTAVTMTIGLTVMVRVLREIAQMVRENTQMVKEAHEASLRTYRAVKGLE
jgi:hypothetical protein